jgi:pimeloyl-ACP methyl ester carboxylesterase
MLRSGPHDTDSSRLVSDFFIFDYSKFTSPIDYLFPCTMVDTFTTYCQPFSRPAYRCMYTLTLLFSFTVGQGSFAQSLSQSFRSFDGVNIHYEVEGKGKPVVLIHGFINSSRSWKQTPLYKDLQKAGFQVITLDLRGNGQSDRPHELAAYQKDAEAKDVMALTKLLGLNHYAVVGYSRGSIIAARLLVLDKHVQSGVLGGMGTGFTDPNWPRRVAFYKAFKGEGEIPEEARGAVNYAKASGADMVALAQMQGAQPSTSPRELSRITKPVLVISGDQDADNGSAEELAKMLGKGTYESVQGGNHNSTTKLVAFSKKVVEFLQQH